MENINFRDYQEKDFEAVKQIWQDVGWLTDENASTLKEIIEDSRVLAGVINGSVEAAVMCTDASLQYMDTKIKASLIDAVTVSFLARKYGLAGRGLAALLAREAEKGIPVSFLGMFEQGYYNQLGYGTGNYYRQVHLDPADLNVPYKCRIPVRLSAKDYKIIHKNRLNRMKLHGRFNVISEIATKSEMDFMKKSFGLGYFDESGKLSHHLWLNPSEKEFGPYSVEWQAYETYEQFLELLSLLQSLGDQVREFSITEPADIQLIDFMKKPIRTKALTKGGKFANYINSNAYWQLRMLNPVNCISNTKLNINDLEFNLKLHDPITNFLDDKFTWRGCGGEYYVKLGVNSILQKGYRENLPLLEAGIGAFSRMWLGVRPASGLSVTDQLKGKPELLKKLDNAFRLPEPQPDWWY